jgi:alkyldihydroxyacetonephosphate synthase
MVYAGWGDPTRRAGLPPHALAWLHREIGSGPARPAAASVSVPPSRLDLPGAHTDDEVRARFATGSSYLDLLALRSGSVDAPDGVVSPADAADVAALLRDCSSRGIAVVPYGGGTSVVGGVSPLRGSFSSVIALDLSRLDQLLDVDEESLTATFQPGVRGPEAERLLNARGLTLGHFPQSYEYATIGGFAATRSSGQASTGYGRFDELVLGVVVQTPAGELRLGRGAASAAGPDLRALVVGSEGVFGVITEVTVRVRRVPEVKRYEGFFFRSFAEGVAALRAMEQAGVAPDVARLSDPDETRVQLALSGASRTQRAYLRARRASCFAVFGWEGTAVTARRKASLSVVEGALSVGTSAGEKWAHGRYDGPYLRDDLLDAGVLVETLETSARWSSLLRTHGSVRSALAGALPGAVVMCHVSHLYPQGASLYFTVLGRQSDDPVGQWTAAKRAASDAIVGSGATITHHHAVGTDHRDWMTAEIGPLGVEVLRSVKALLDPAGILNPGKLIP